MSIALDAMGGDHAPEAVIAGALDALPQLRQDLHLVGDLARLRPLLPDPLPSRIRLVPSTQVVEMDDKPTDAYRKKKDSSLMIATRMVKDGQAQAMVSAGNTGAATAFAHLTWRQLPGISRPAIASRMPNAHGGFALLDAGASPDAEPSNLVEFAILGRAYAELVLGRKSPRVHLLNIGEEAGKGNALVKAAYDRLVQYPWFAGNIEGKDMWKEPCDVVICDAFVGNVVLKTSEGLAELIGSMIRAGVPDSPLTRWMYWPVRRVMAPIRREMDYAEVGGSPLLGLNGICTICHGRSDAKAIRNALLATQTAVEKDLLGQIRTGIEEIKTH
ncbi:MAG: phosphate acyltransferase PlsX [Fimbriimonadaceae bacterium]|nr:phosphate acyltransferase PlsX [Fimbriimonadaceae bacterium]